MLNFKLRPQSRPSHCHGKMDYCGRLACLVTWPRMEPAHHLVRERNDHHQEDGLGCRFGEEKRDNGDRGSQVDRSPGRQLGLDDGSIVRLQFSP